MIRIPAAAILAASVTLAYAGDSLEFPLTSGKALTVRWKQPVTDADLASPSGYFHAEPPTARLVESVHITNRGSKPAKNPILWINGTAYLTPRTAFEALGISSEAGIDEIYQRWIERCVHASSELKANDHALEIFRTFGASFCGEGSKAWAELITLRGGSARMVRLTGHVVPELTENGVAAVVDGDQNAFFLRLDNETLASEEDLRTDPFLIIRTKIYGRQMPYNLAASWMNASRLDRALIEPKKPFRVKKSAASVEWSLLPGEQIVYTPDPISSPVLGRSDAQTKDRKLQKAAIRVDVYPNLEARNAGGHRMTVPYPVLGWTGADGTYHLLARAGDEPLYELTWTPETAPRTIHCQAAAAQFPGFPLTENTVELETVGPDDVLHVVVEISDSALALSDLLPPKVTASERGGHGVPEFDVSSDEPLEKLWWQISADEAFRRIVPNFDNVGMAAPQIRLTSLMDTTFFSAGQRYFLRAKGFANGRWSDWSKGFAFQVAKPDPPRRVKIDVGADGKTRLTWAPAGGELWIFGSDRIDFVPEIYSPTQPLRMENNTLREAVKNENRLAAVDAATGSAEVEPFAFYRVILRSDEIFSVPSAILAHPSDAVQARATVLQNSHTPPASDIATVQSLPVISR